MKFTTGKLRAACDTIDPTTGQWKPHVGNWVVANESNFNSLHNTVDMWKQRADKRNGRIEFHYDGSEEYVVNTWTDVVMRFGVEFVPFLTPPPFQPWVVISGNPLDGFEIIGPFATAEEAAERASGDDGDWWTTRINAERQWQS